MEESLMLTLLTSGDKFQSWKEQLSLFLNPKGAWRCVEESLMLTHLLCQASCYVAQKSCLYYNISGATGPRKSSS